MINKHYNQLIKQFNNSTMSKRYLATYYACAYGNVVCHATAQNITHNPIYRYPLHYVG